MGLLKVLAHTTEDEYREGKLWYSKSRRECRAEARRLGIPFIQYVGVVAAISPRKGWPDNIPDASRWIEKGDRVSTGSNLKKCREILTTTNRDKILKILNGPKVTRFFLNLYSRRYRVVTIDSHAYAALGWEGKLNKSNLRKARDEYKRVATLTGIKPYQLQAIIWLTYKRIKESK